MALEDSNADSAVGVLEGFHSALGNFEESCVTFRAKIDFLLDSTDLFKGGFLSPSR
jgi:hypothetical protein